VQLKWLEDFVALATEKSFSRAAAQRNVTHPAFGRRIRALESWAGAALVERGRQPVALTKEGQLLLAAVRQGLSSLQQVRQTIRLAQGGREHLVIATGRTLSRILLPELLARFLVDKEHPATTVRVHSGSLHDAAALLEAGDADLLLCFAQPEIPLVLDLARFVHLEVRVERLVPVSRPTAPGRPAFALTAGSRKAVPVIAFSSTLAMGRAVELHLAHVGARLKLHRVMEIDFAEAAREFALRGIGIAWLPQTLVETDLRRGELCLAGGAQHAIELPIRMYRPSRWSKPAAERFGALLAAGQSA
jgi:DNA-binding transcriptional LysR family regulator